MGNTKKKSRRKRKTTAKKATRCLSKRKKSTKGISSRKRSRSTSEDSTNSEASSKGRKLPNFVTSLRKIINETSNNIVSWSKDGTKFFVYDKDYFTKNIQCKYFSSTSFSSFVRQLNFYQFKKVTEIDENGTANKLKLCFQHPNFRRDNPEEMHLIVRKVNQTAVDREINGMKKQFTELQAQFIEVLEQVKSLGEKVAQLSTKIDTKPPLLKRVCSDRSMIGLLPGSSELKLSRPPPLERFLSSDYNFLDGSLPALSPRVKPVNML